MEKSKEVEAPEVKLDEKPQNEKKVQFEIEKEQEKANIVKNRGDENQDIMSEVSYNRNEIKSRKALLKAGMKPESGFNRITLKKKDGLIFVIEKPEVLSNGNSYCVFGELKIADMNANIQ